MKEENRRIGNTTRLVDYYIQELFNNFGKSVTIKDHYDHKASHKHLMDKIINRLQNEHKNISFIAIPDFNVIRLEPKNSLNLIANRK